MPADARSWPLTAWNQAALRGYIRQVHCFPTDGGRDALDSFAHGLGEALKLVCRRTPYMAGRLTTSKQQPGVVILHTSKADEIELKTCDMRHDDNLAYAKLRDRGFPAGAFVGPLFNNDHTLVEDAGPIPVAEFLLILVDGGILMCPFVFHAITDGVGVTYFLSAAAEAWRDPEAFMARPLSYPSKIDIPVPSSHAGMEPDDRLAKALGPRCPEFDLTEPGADHDGHLATMYGVSEVKFGVIFVFGPDKVRLIKEAVVSAGYPSTPSTFACLTALSWAFMTTTRLQTVGIADESRQKDRECRVVIPTWWGDRLFQELLGDYAGNAVAFTEPRHGAADLFTIADCASTDLEKCKDALTRVIQNLETSLNSVDEDFVKTRSALFNAVSDPRLAQYNFRPSDNHQLFFNSWRRLGADIQWPVPNISGPRLMTADAVRKTQNEWNESAGLIMPGRRDQREYEAVLSSDADSMAALRSNEAWKSWIEKEIF